MLRAKRMTSVIKADQVRDQELEINAIVKEFVDILRRFIVVKVKLSYVLIRQAFLVRKPISEVFDPNIFTKEDGACLFFVLLVDSLEYGVLAELTLIQCLHEVLHRA